MNEDRFDVYVLYVIWREGASKVSKQPAVLLRCRISMAGSKSKKRARSSDQPAGGSPASGSPGAPDTAEPHGTPKCCDDARPAGGSASAEAAAPRVTPSLAKRRRKARVSRLRDLSSEFEKERQFFAKVDGVSLVMETPEAVAAAKPASAGTASTGSAPSKTAPKKSVRTYSKAKQRADAEVQAEYDAYVTGACFVCAATHGGWVCCLPRTDRAMLIVV